MARPELDHCPECGATFRSGRLACPECGSDADTGWKSEEELQYQSIEIPDTYEELVASGTPRQRPIFLLAAVLMIFAILLFVVFRIGF